MKHQRTCTFNVVMHERPRKQEWQRDDRKGVILKLKTLLIPENPETTSIDVEEAEFIISSFNNNQPDYADLTDIYYENIRDFLQGNKYVKVEVIMGGRSMARNKTIDTYSPYINKVEIVETSEETKPYIVSALSKIR